ncbi:MAG: hypothetical protein LUM44_09730 [Pyrinomonadaceae bacterium]|nr:hypothetical protein [Pyrinomonadaceae bacterium]
MTTIQSNLTNFQETLEKASLNLTTIFNLISKTAQNARDNNENDPETFYDIINACEMAKTELSNVFRISGELEPVSIENKSLSEQLASILQNPHTPTDIYNGIVDALADMDFRAAHELDTPENIERILGSSRNA